MLFLTDAEAIRGPIHSLQLKFLHFFATKYRNWYRFKFSSFCVVGFASICVSSWKLWLSEFGVNPKALFRLKNARYSVSQNLNIYKSTWAK